jgi:uncharacterized protein YbcV (DUF1398 family)
MTFTLEQIRAAQTKVKTGADFPAYARELAQLGVTNYETFLGDGHTAFRGTENFHLESAPRDSLLEIAPISNADDFRSALKIHQAGQTDFPTFCLQAAEAGIEKWRVDLSGMTCTYFDKTGKEIVVEKIPMNL